MHVLFDNIFFLIFIFLRYDIIFTNYAASVGRFCPPLNYIKQGRTMLMVLYCSLTLTHSISHAHHKLSGLSHLTLPHRVVRTLEYFSLVHLRTPPTVQWYPSSGHQQRQHCLLEELIMDPPLLVVLQQTISQLRRRRQRRSAVIDSAVWFQMRQWAV